jgi:hypothetical protein
MPQTKTQRNGTARKTAAARTSRKAAGTGKPAAARTEKHEQTSPVGRTADLSDEVLKSLESGQRAAIEAVRKFVDTVDKRLPALGERPSGRQEVVDAAMEMADRLVHTQYDFIRSVVQSAGKALSRQDGGK